MKVKVITIQKYLVYLGLFLTFFSSACLWNEESLQKYIYCSLFIVFISFVTYCVKPFRFTRLIHNHYVLWVLATYTLFELYGIFYLRAGEFNWDFIFVSGVLQISITLMLMCLKSLDEVIDTYCKTCISSLIVVCVYMFYKGSIRLSNITLGSSFGLELSGNRNTVATIIGIMLIPVVYSAIENNSKWNWPHIFIALFGTVCMLLTGSKKGIIIVILLAVMVFLIDRSTWKFLIFPLVIIIGIYLIFNVPIFYDVIGFRLKDMFASLGIGNAVTGAQSTNIRNSFILMGLRSMWKHPFFGGGMNYFQYINHVRYYSHNNYIELLNNFGIFGTLIYYVPAIKTINPLKKYHANYQLLSRNAYLFLMIYLISKFALDYAMVSYSTMCVFNLQFLLVFEVTRRLKND